MDEKVDPILEAEFQKKLSSSQIFVVALSWYSSWVSGIMVISSMLTTITPNHRCKIPQCDSESTTYNDTFLKFTTPWNNKNSQWEHCSHFSLINESLRSCSPESFSNQTVKCNEYVYDVSEILSSSVTEFDVVCSSKWLVNFDRSAFMVGMFLGTLLSGYITDKYGRRVGLFASTAILIFGTLFIIVSPFYFLVVMMRVAMGIGSTGCFQTSFLIVVESVGIEHRTKCGILVSVPYSFGMLSFVLLSSYLRNWKSLLFAGIFPAYGIAFYYWVLPESIHWLMSKNRNEEENQLRKKALNDNGQWAGDVVKSNSNTLDNAKGIDDVKIMVRNDYVGKEKSFLDMMRPKILRIRVLILLVCWCTVGVSYFGFLYYENRISNSIYINAALPVLMDIPAYITSSLLIDKTGRKYWHVIAFLLSGVACIAIPLVSDGTESENLVTISMVLVGKFGIAAAFGSLFVYTSELFPTEFRAVGVGSCAMSSRLGSVLSYFVSDLGSISPFIPPLTFGSLSLISAFLILLLPETKGTMLPQTVEECEQIGKHKQSFKFVEANMDK